MNLILKKFLEYTFILIILFIYPANVIPEAEKTENKKSSIKDLDYSELSKIPILHEGRIKPLDTFARVHLLIFSGKSSLPNSSAIEWLIELLLDHQNADNQKIFKINNTDMLNALELDKTPSHKYSFNDVEESLTKIFNTIVKLSQKNREEKTPAQNQLTDFFYKFLRYYDLKKSLSLIIPRHEIKSGKLANKIKLPKNKKLTYLDLQRRFNKIKKLAEVIKKKNPSALSDYEKELLELYTSMQLTIGDSSSEIFRIIPPQWGDNSDLWHSPWSVVNQGKGSPKTAKYLKHWENLAGAYFQNDKEKWNKNISALLLFSMEISQNYVNPNKLNLEKIYNTADLFTNSLVSYIIAFIILAIGWIIWPERFRKISFAFLAIGLFLHFMGILLRIIIMERAPVATLYESIIAVGFISVFFSVYLENRRKDGMGLLIGTLSGCVLHLIGMSYVSDGDSMGMLIAVLNTQFWLVTHVVTISIGYGACFVGGLLGHIFVVRKIFRPNNKEKLNELHKNMVGICLVSLFFTLLGTVLGGIWADQSWGRFWGWDPKENGALLIVLWLIWLLHGRRISYIKSLGFAFGMIFSNIIVVLAWFGVNLLNVGLHSYGFTENIAFNLALYCTIEILFISVGYYLVNRNKKRMISMT
jgi:ABC-type transport system involved in cytochrome c biogenesis permease subunit